VIFLNEIFFQKKKDHDNRAWDWEDKNKSLITNGETEFFFNSKLNKKINHQ